MSRQTEILDAYLFLQENNRWISSETLEFMKESSLAALEPAPKQLFRALNDIGAVVTVERNVADLGVWTDVHLVVEKSASDKHLTFVFLNDEYQYSQ